MTPPTSNDASDLDHTPFLVPQGQAVRLADRPTTPTGVFGGKSNAKDSMRDDTRSLRDTQRVLWAADKHAVLIILQGMDTAGKDSTIRHVMTGVNPHGVRVQSFKAPNDEELQHHFLWRPMRHLPERGQIMFFNRSYYEEVLIVRVHPEFLEPQRRAHNRTAEAIWKHRFEEINTFERSLTDSGTLVLKFYLHLSRDEQRDRLLARIDNPEKHWKFNPSDVDERAHWPKYMAAYEDAIASTSTTWAPWYVIPADEKWFARAVIADVIRSRIEALDLAYPVVSPEAMMRMGECRARLERDD